MKKKLKLLSSLPTVAIIASVPATLVSCKSNYVEPIYSTTITEGYDDKDIQPLESDDLYDQKDVTDLYLSQINNNPMMFVKDMTCAAARKYTDFANVFLKTGGETQYKDPDNAKLIKCEFGFSIPKFGQTSVWEMGFEDEIYTTISFKQKIYLEYQYQDPQDKIQIVKKISANIDYSNVLFMISESNWQDLEVATSPNWLIGVIDPWFQSDAFWVYQYNTKPWSINYGFSYEVTKTIFGSPDVNIYNCTYYSGNIDSANKLYNLWNFSKRLDGKEHSEIPCESALENMMVKCILCMDYGSKILANIVNQPDVCISDQLHGDYSSGQPTSLSGITFIYPKIGSINPDDVTIQLNHENDITCQGITTTGKVTIAKDATLTEKTENSSSTSQEYELPITVSDVGGTTAGDILSFDVPYRSLKIKITYGDDVWNTELFLHYNAFILTCKE